MPFGMGFGELVLMLCIVVVAFGAKKLPSLGDGIGDALRRLRDQQGRGEPPRLVFRSKRSRPSTFSEWLLVVAAVVLGAIVIANARVFNFTAAELVVLGLLAIIFLGRNLRDPGGR
jgi:sec-independent protein translocase protein TatA